ncbi:MAG TPA: VOC family protein [Pyrinomonadaceae bacterium]
MSTTVEPIPEGFHTVTPCITVEDASRLIEFLEKSFDAVVQDKFFRADGAVGNASVRLGDSMVMIFEAHDQWKAKPASFYIYVPDCDAIYQKALAAGGASLLEPADMFYGDRNGGVQDFAGNEWWIATHVKDVSPDEIQEMENARRQTAG